MARIKKPINVEIGSRVKEKRIRAHLTREVFAGMVGYSPSFIQEIECGRSGLSSESMKAFALALNVSVDSLIFGDGAGGEEHLIRRLQTLPAEKVKCLETILDELITFMEQLP